MKPDSSHVATILFMVAVLVLIYLSNSGQLQQIRSLLGSSPTSGVGTGVAAGAALGGYIPAVPGSNGTYVVPPGGGNLQGIGTLPASPGSTPFGPIGQVSGDIGSLESIFG